MAKTLVEINERNITLGQFLKYTSIISSGGMAKPFLAQTEIYVNGEAENRRGKKLYDQDVVLIPNIGEFQIHSIKEK